MEEVDEHLMITDIEISCWEEQLKQMVSQSHTLIIFIHWDQFLLVTLTNQFKISLKIFPTPGICRDHPKTSTS